MMQIFAFVIINNDERGGQVNFGLICVIMHLKIRPQHIQEWRLEFACSRTCIYLSV